MAIEKYATPPVLAKAVGDPSSAVAHRLPDAALDAGFEAHRALNIRKGPSFTLTFSPPLLVDALFCARLLLCRGGAGQRCSGLLAGYQCASPVAGQKWQATWWGTSSPP